MLPLLSEPPSFVVLPEAQTALPNATVRFRSSFSGTPPFTVRWFKDEAELMTGPTCFTGLDGPSCFLELCSVGPAQTGLYSCQVSNEAGSVRCSADLLVKGGTANQLCGSFYPGLRRCAAAVLFFVLVGLFAAAPQLQLLVVTATVSRH